jgi:hypothetical protein
MQAFKHVSHHNHGGWLQPFGAAEVKQRQQDHRRHADDLQRGGSLRNAKDNIATVC